jgi:hypothetical protein
MPITRESPLLEALLREAWDVAVDVARSAWSRECFTIQHWDRGPWREWRESMQLLTAGLIYLRSALRHQAMLDEQRARHFHGLLYSLSRHDWIDAILVRPGAIVDYTSNLQDLFRNMHLASVSLRLPSAVFWVHRRFGGGLSPFLGLENRRLDDWSRDKVYDGSPKLEPARPLYVATRWRCHCRSKPPRLGAIGLRVCLAAVVGHRDSFAHGELPSPEHSKRGLWVGLKQCRVAEAQLRLIRWSLAALAQKAECP